MNFTQFRSSVNKLRKCFLKDERTMTGGEESYVASDLTPNTNEKPVNIGVVCSTIIQSFNNFHFRISNRKYNYFKSDKFISEAET